MIPLRSIVVSALVCASLSPALAAVPKLSTGSRDLPQMCFDAGRMGLLDVEVDTAACLVPTPACGEAPPAPATATNRQPVKLVLQLATPEAIEDLAFASISVSTQFSPGGNLRLAVLDCPGCFEQRAGGTYAIWVAPIEGLWPAGSSFVLVRLQTRDVILPALARIDIPLNVMPPQGEPPHAVALATPYQVRPPADVIFDGNRSYDPDSPITCFQWEIHSSLGGTEIVQGSSTIVRHYDVPQSVEATLRVSDDPRASLGCRQNAPPVAPDLFSQFTAVALTELVPNRPPTARPSGPMIGTVREDASVPGRYLCAVSMSGCASFDPDGAIVSWEWNWGDRVDLMTTCVGQHTYTIYDSTEFTVSLVVYDNGDGSCGPRPMGPDPCTTRMVSAPASTTVTCTVPQR